MQRYSHFLAQVAHPALRIKDPLRKLALNEFLALNWGTKGNMTTARRPPTLVTVVICCGSEEIAGHRRSYEREELIFDPLHYLALLERKTNALDQAAPLAGWELPEQFTCLRRLLEARLGKPGKREYVQVLRLLEDFRFEHRAIGLDAVSAVPHRN